MAKENKKGRSRVFYAVLSLFPGLGQIFRGRILTGLLFFMNVVLYTLPLFVDQKIEYDVRTPSFLIALACYLCSPLDAFLIRSSFLVLALLVSLFFFGAGFFGAFFILPRIDI
jgi:hypothetical protein